jgi:hypothetical protein
MKALKQLFILLFLSLLPLMINHCKKEDDTDMTYYKDSLGCFPNLPSPDLIYLGKMGSHYQLSIKNCASFPNELFVSSPDLPPCGQNPKASRTWVFIYNSETDEQIYGYCGFNLPCDASELYFSIPEGYHLPFEVYVKYIDRKCELEYVSNSVVINQ